MTTPTEDSGHGELEPTPEHVLALAQRAAELPVERFVRPSDGPAWHGWTHVRETSKANERFGREEVSP